MASLNLVYLTFIIQVIMNNKQVYVPAAHFTLKKQLQNIKALTLTFYPYIFRMELDAAIIIII